MRDLFPAFLDLAGRRVLLVGGGPVAAAKLAPLLDARADVTVVAPDVVPAIAVTGVTIHRRPFEPADLDGCWFVVAAAPPAVNAHVQREGDARRVFVNAVDDPAHATVFSGSVVRRGPVTVAISTGGEAPALARLLREALERLLPDALAEWTAIARALRNEWRREGTPMTERRNDLLKVLVALRAADERSPSPTPAGIDIARDERDRLHGSNGWSGHRDDVCDTPAPDAPAPRRRAEHAPSRPAWPSSFPTAIVGAGPGDPDLLTRRAAAYLAAADVVFYDSLVPAAVLALAARARHVHVGRRSGRETVSAEHVHELLIADVERGARVVRLKGGDPFVFGRGAEDVLALARAGIACDVVPGLSSAFAGPALAGIPVTHRGTSSSIHVVTGHDLERFAASTRSLTPADLTLVVLMGLRHRRAIADTLCAAGWPASTPAAVVMGASWPESTIWTGTLASLGIDDDLPASDELPGVLVIGDVVSVRQDIEACRRTAALAGTVMSHG